MLHRYDTGLGWRASPGQKPSGQVTGQKSLTHFHPWIILQTKRKQLSAYLARQDDDADEDDDEDDRDTVERGRAGLGRHRGLL